MRASTGQCKVPGRRMVWLYRLFSAISGQSWLDILSGTEDIIWIVPGLEFRQPVVGIGSIGCPHAIGCIARAKVVDVDPLAVWGKRIEQLARPRDMPVGFSRIRPPRDHREVIWRGPIRECRLRRPNSRHRTA